MVDEEQKIANAENLDEEEDVAIFTRSFPCPNRRG